MVNEWTRNDLPDASVATDKYGTIGSMYFPAVDAYRDAVVEHLNAHYPKPSPEHVVIGGRLTISESQFKRERDVFAHRLENQSETIAEMQGVIKGLHRAHEIVEGERDQAREQWKKWEHKAGEWKARAEAAEQYAQAVSDSNRDNADRASKAERERDKWRARAEVAEARTAAAVSRADIEKAIRGKVWAANREPNKAGFHRVHVDWATDAVWSLVSGSDPAVFVVRESDISAVEVTEHAAGWSTESKKLVSGWGKGEHLSVDMDVDRYRAELLNALAVQRAIEAEQAVDPLLDKAQEFAALADWELTDREAELLHTVAAYVLGQEVK